MSRYADGGSGPSPHELKVDLDYLISVGQVLLPALADDYGTLHDMAADADQQGAPLFAWSPGASNAPAGFQSGSEQTGAQWSALCQMLQRAFGHSTTNLRDAASAVLAIESRYRETDHVSAAGLKKVWNEPDGAWSQDQGFPQRSHVRFGNKE